jgi:hypothetical protein
MTDKRKPSWEMAVIGRLLAISLGGGFVGLACLGLEKVTNAGCLTPVAGMGFAVMILFGVFGLAGLAVEGF